jgi:hypothetical protein
LGGSTTRPLEARGTQSSICKERKGHHMSVHTSTSGDIYIIICFLLQVFDFLGEVFHFSQDLFGRASGRFIIIFYLFPATSLWAFNPFFP